MTDGPRALVISPCQSQCGWTESGELIDGERVFACAACGSEWVASEAWTPVSWEGIVPAAVQEERARQGRGRPVPGAADD